MNALLAETCEALDSLGEAILKQSKDDRPLVEINGWNYPPLSRSDLGNMATNISTKIRRSDTSEIGDDLAHELKEIPRRIAAFQSTTLVYLFNGNGHTAVPLYISLIQWITTVIEPLFSWEALSDNKAMPTQLARRLRTINAELSEIIPQKEALEEQIKLIHDATEAAENLPTDLQALKEARNRVTTLSDEVSYCTW
jgi:hypothetical protein